MSDIEEKRERVRAIASEFYKRGDVLGWFEALYKEAAGDNEVIPWADLEPNRFFRRWAEDIGLKGNGERALVVGCGLGDDAAYLDDLGFDVTAFDISPSAIDWAKKLHANRKIKFAVMDLFKPFRGWTCLQAGGPRPGGFDFVLEVYTIQPLPMEMRQQTIDAIAAFVAPGGRLVVVTRGRGDDEEVDELPWPVSRKELARFEDAGLKELSFTVYPPDEDDECERFVVEYARPA
jgi:SAM-dependent methyltransferase